MEFRESFWEARKNPFIFFAVAYLFSLAVNLTSTAIARDTSPGWWWSIVIAVPVLVFGTILSPYFPRLFARLFGSRQLSVRLPYPAPQFAGLVVLASVGAKGLEPAQVAIRHHHPRLQRLWIVHSRRSLADAATLKADTVGAGLLPDAQVTLLDLSDPDFQDPEAVKRCLEDGVYANLHGLAPSDVVIDITGGRKGTSIGAFLAGLPQGRWLEIVNPKRTNERAQGEEPEEHPTLIAIDYRLKRVP
jgi:hypothetical protein